VVAFIGVHLTRPKRKTPQDHHPNDSPDPCTTYVYRSNAYNTSTPISAEVHPAGGGPNPTDGALREVLAAVGAHRDVSAGGEHRLVHPLVPADDALPGLRLTPCGHPQTLLPTAGASSSLPGAPGLRRLPQIRLLPPPAHRMWRVLRVGLAGRLVVLTLSVFCRHVLNPSEQPIFPFLQVTLLKREDWYDMLCCPSSD